MAFQIKPIHGLRSFAIVAGSVDVGMLYPPSPAEGEGHWEIWPSILGERMIPDIPDGKLYRSFPSKADALAFLGIQPEQVAA